VFVSCDEWNNYLFVLTVAESVQVIHVMDGEKKPYMRLKLFIIYIFLSFIIFFFYY